MDYIVLFNENNVTLQISGRLDSTTSPLLEEKINSELEGKAIKKVTIDAIKLDYISSAGLRVVLKLMKRYDVEIINVSSEVYEIFDMTGFTEMVKVRKAFKEMSVEGCKVIGEGANGIVYRYNSDTIIKVYKKNDVLPLIQRERELAKKAFVLGIPTAISYDVVRVGDSYASVFELLDSNSMSYCIGNNPEKLEEYAKEFAHLLKQIHETIVNKNDMPPIINTVNKWYKNIKECFDDATSTKLKELISNIKEVPLMVHGDFHTNNVMVQGDELILIDMDTLSYGNPVIELGIVDFNYVTMNLYDKDNSERFLKISESVSRKFFDYFINEYFDGLSKEQIDLNKKKISLLSHLRALSHMIRRGFDSYAINGAKEAIIKLVSEIDDLNIE